MSMFMPEGANTPSLQSPGVAQPTNPEVTDADIKLMQRALGAASQYPNMIPDSFMAYVFDYIQAQRLQIPIGQVFGFTQFTAQAALTVAGTYTLTSAVSTAFADSTDTVGPEIDGLGDGSYVIFYGGRLSVSLANSGAQMGINVNGVAPAEVVACNSVYDVNVAKAVVTDLSAGSSNSVKIQYRYINGSGLSNSAFFTDRWLIALRYAN